MQNCETQSGCFGMLGKQTAEHASPAGPIDLAARSLRRSGIRRQHPQ